MSHFRDSIRMSGSELDAFWDGCRTLILCTIGPDGVPDPVPMWFIRRPDGLYMRTYAKSQKVTNLRRDPRVSVLAETGEGYAELRGIQISGTVELCAGEELICGLFADLMIKYEGMDPAHRAAAAEGYRAKASHMVALRLHPERTVSWDHRKLAAAHSGG